VKPSSARWAIAWRGDSAISGGVASTTRRPDWPIWRTTGWKNSYSSVSSSVDAIPEAS
jgi:hypothetical protein